MRQIIGVGAVEGSTARLASKLREGVLAGNLRDCRHKIHSMYLLQRLENRIFDLFSLAVPARAAVLERDLPGVEFTLSRAFAVGEFEKGPAWGAMGGVR